MPHLDNPGESVFIDIKVKDLPKDIQKRHRARTKRMDVLRNKLNKIREEGQKDLTGLMSKNTLRKRKGQ